MFATEPQPKLSRMAKTQQSSPDAERPDRVNSAVQCRCVKVGFPREGGRSAYFSSVPGTDLPDWAQSLNSPLTARKLSIGCRCATWERHVQFAVSGITPDHRSRWMERHVNLSSRLDAKAWPRQRTLRGGPWPHIHPSCLIRIKAGFRQWGEPRKREMPSPAGGCP